MRRSHSSVSAAGEPVDVCLLLEGTYPYVRGGVSAWVHDLVTALPSLGFGLVALVPHRQTKQKRTYELPLNVRFLENVYCHRSENEQAAKPRGRLVRRLSGLRRGGSEHAVMHALASALERLHVGAKVDDGLIDLLAGSSVDPEDFLSSDVHMELAKRLARALAPTEAFADLYWHLRSMHGPLLNMLATELPAARLYHACSTGYGGFLGAIASRRTGTPFLLTEHGIYTDERDLELLRARIAPVASFRMGREAERMWSRFFSRLAQVAYRQAGRVVTISGIGRDRASKGGCALRKLEVVPNGVELKQIPVLTEEEAKTQRFRIGFVGRVVPIKDVVTFIKACDLALKQVDLEAWIVGPEEEEPAYAAQCRKMVAALGRQRQIKFWGHQNVAAVYPRIGALVLTSLSEGQPLVVLEAQAMGVPVVATAVGACGELLEGHTAADRALGPSGLLTRVSSPEETARAIVALAADPALRALLGARGRQRVARYYGRGHMLARYEQLYKEVSSRRA